MIQTDSLLREITMKNEPPLDTVEDLIGLTEEQIARDQRLMAEEAFAGPAPFANRYFLSQHGPVVRLSFMDQANLEHGPRFRSAVSLALHDAEELSGLLNRFITDAKAFLSGDLS
ncbi:MAG TPA: hypothetical protein VGR32_07600 [Brevundimonas sp.]|uniref:hypothetical protein n=1 Tax=Brevundimonas sp. TaxID=1871086 RepID=UPI002DE31BE1|nr:hypothetical protein [Brevundimonas sp.]